MAQFINAREDLVTEAIDGLLAERNVRHVNFQEWEKISEQEYARANPPQPRERFTRVEEMLAILD